ncbi:MAG TPA: MarR family transcriptional regulator [Natronosporangium sp.]
MNRGGARELAWLELHQVSRLLSGELSRRLEAEAEMSLIEHDMLWYLANVPDRRVIMSALADRLMISRSGATRLIDRMVRRGWVSREADPNNRRLTYAVLTPAGAKAVRRSVQVVWRVRPGLFDERLTDADVADLRRVLGKLLRRLDVVD